MSRFLEPAWLTGARGQDAAVYSVLASQRGIASKRPVPEFVIATLGLTQAALAYGNDEILTVLPVLQSTVQPMQAFSTYQQRYQHNAGGGVSAIFASLGVLVTLGNKYPIADFAFAYHGGRGFYYGGLLGLHRLCGQFGDVRDLAEQAFFYLQRSSRSDPGIALDLARLTADFVKSPSLETLTDMVRVKSRLLSNPDTNPWIFTASSQLLGTQTAIKEALLMVSNDNRIPPPSEGLVQALGQVFRAEESGTWIGSYIELEKSHKADEFYSEVAKILSRALSRVESCKGSKWLSPAKLKESISLLSSPEVLNACEPSNKSHFQAHKTTFLLRILASMKSPANESTKSKGDKQ